MPDHNTIYTSQAMDYDAMIQRQPLLDDVIRDIRDYRALDVLDLGAGTGRLSAFLAKEARSLVCTDISGQMLEVLDHNLSRQGLVRNWSLVEADHRSLPLADASIDVAVSGWSICYLASTSHANWQLHVDTIMAELRRVLRTGGTIIIMETMGTGTETPNPPQFLQPYYAYLEQQHGFSHRWMRLDYTFEHVEAAKKHTAFFFGDELAEKIAAAGWNVVPECAGIWWKHV